MTPQRTPRSRRAADAYDVRRDRYGSWGTPPDGATHLAEKLMAELTRRNITPVGSLPAVQLPDADEHESRIDGELRTALSRCGELSTDSGVRAAFSTGRSFADCLAARGVDGLAIEPCDAVLRPRDADAVLRALTVAAEAGVAIVPVGGGSSVVGGIEPLRSKDSQPVVAIDTTALSGVLDVDEQSQLARVGAGTWGPQLEDGLAKWGLTLGHIPQSFEQSTPGGWIAARSSGQQSMQVGRIEDLVAGMTLLTPEGEIDVPDAPAASSGPIFGSLVTGSEGTFGVISEAVLRVRQLPEKMHFATWLFRSFGEAADAVRDVARSGIRPAILRASDPVETSFSILGALGDGVPRKLANALAAKSGFDDACMVTCISSGSDGAAKATGIAAGGILGKHGGKHVGGRPAREWYASRFLQPYARDVMFDGGLLVDTLETSVRWSRIERLHSRIGEALRGALGPDSLVGCHISHVYPDGASLYFTFIARPGDDGPLATWRSAKLAVASAIHVTGATPSHHHGVGTMHANIREAGLGAEARVILAAARNAADPAGIMNPGKLESPGRPETAVNHIPAFAG